MGTVAVSRDILLWALDRSGRTVDDVLNAFPRLRDWLAGEAQPTLPQLEKFAKTTSTPLGFLFLAKPPEERMPIPHYRTENGDFPHKPSSELLDTIRAMQLRQAWMRDEVMVYQGQVPLPFVGSAHVGEEAEAVAEKMRKALRFDSHWAEQEKTWTDAVTRLREAIEDARILVAANGIVGNNTHRKLDPGEFRGFVLVDPYAPLVFVNNADGKAAQMFTLAHELAHVFFGSSAAFDLRQLLPSRDKTEQACDQVAAEFLVPARHLREAWAAARDDADPFQALAVRFKVSEIVTARRALDLRLIDRERFIRRYEDYRESERRKVQGGGDFHRNQIPRIGVRFGAAVVRAAREGRLGYSEAYRLTDLHGKTFEHFADTLAHRGA